MSMIEEMEDAPQTVLCCSACAAVNLRQRKFCSQCGAALWEPCLQCGEMCAVGENYCGACGANLGQLAATGSEQLEADLRTVEELRSACRFDEALARLVASPRTTIRAWPTRCPGQNNSFSKSSRNAIGGGSRPRKIASAPGNVLTPSTSTAPPRSSKECPCRSAAAWSRTFGRRSRRGGRRLPPSTASCARRSERIACST